LSLFNPITGKYINIESAVNMVKLEGSIKMFTRKYIWARLKVDIAGKQDNQFKFKWSIKDNIDNCSSVVEDINGSKICILVDSLSGKLLKSKYFTYKLPAYKGAFNINELPLLVSDRSTPLEISNTVDEDYKYSILIGKWYYSVNRDTTIEVENSVGRVFFSKIMDSDNADMLNYRRSLRLKKKIIYPNEYKDFKRLMDVWGDKNYKELIFSFKP
jgi:hypothetical protein